MRYRVRGSSFGFHASGPCAPSASSAPLPSDRIRARRSLPESRPFARDSALRPPVAVGSSPIVRWRPGAPPVRTTFLISAARAEQLPALELPEVAFLGRSNVGKSSLLNALTQARIARTSSTPGRTQHINLFRVHAGFGDFVLADLPGYGFAKAPKAVRASWGPLVETYLERRSTLRAGLLLLDARREAEADDLSLFETLRTLLHRRGAVAQVVVTKIDKLPKAKRKPRVAELARRLELPREAVIATSASGRLGLDDLWTRLSAWVG